MCVLRPSLGLFFMGGYSTVVKPLGALKCDVFAKVQRKQRALKHSENEDEMNKIPMQRKSSRIHVHMWIVLNGFSLNTGRLQSH